MSRRVEKVGVQEGVVEAKLNPAETAPREKVILIDVGMPCLFIGMYSRADEKWVYAVPSCGYLLLNEEWWFENEYASEIHGWLPMPEVPDTGS